MPSMVVVPSVGRQTRRVRLHKVHSILSNRIQDSEEQFLVRWKTEDPENETPPLSWHTLNELARCLELVQDYLFAREQTPRPNPKKRKTPDSERPAERRPSPSVSSSTVSVPLNDVDVYNGVLDVDIEGFVICRTTTSSEKKGILNINIRNIPTPEMLNTAIHSKLETTLRLIRAEYVRRLEKVPGKKIHLKNLHDWTTPSLRFRYISESILQSGVFKADPATQEGCQECSPHMGRGIGCEYTKKCACLEYAAVDESRIIEPELRNDYDRAVRLRKSLMGFPKKFPYFAEGTKQAGCLVPFYLRSRNPIYECNDNCKCGAHCRNKKVQFGRTVELEIFRTSGGRGWGLRCRQRLREGQFIDTYRGEIITDAEATAREAHSPTSTTKANKKASYLYALDKFQESEEIPDEEIYVVDGEFMGGPTVFMNHSCEPNCRQYTVSYNKNDPRVYDLAFFACRDIEAGEELTFDYLDKEEGDEGEEGEKVRSPPADQDAVPCLCGAERCRKWLWT